MKLTWIVIIIFIIQIYMAIKFYIRVNFGREKGEVKDINKYIYFTLGITSILILIDKIML